MEEDIEDLSRRLLKALDNKTNEIENLSQKNDELQEQISSNRAEVEQSNALRADAEAKLKELEYQRNEVRSDLIKELFENPKAELQDGIQKTAGKSAFVTVVFAVISIVITSAYSNYLSDRSRKDTGETLRAELQKNIDESAKVTQVVTETTGSLLKEIQSTEEKLEQVDKSISQLIEATKIKDSGIASYQNISEQISAVDLELQNITESLKEERKSREAELIHSPESKQELEELKSLNLKLSKLEIVISLLTKEVEGDSDELAKNIVSQLDALQRIVKNFQKKNEFLTMISAMDPEAVWKIGNEFYNERDFITARKYYKISADKGNIYGQYSYGVMLFHGEGGRLDQDEGLVFIRIAAKKGHKLAKREYAIYL